MNSGHSRTDAEVWQAWGDFLERYHWTAAATLTFSKPTHPELAARTFESFIRNLELRSQGRVGWFLVIENTAAGLSHIHALLDGDSLTPEHVGEAWRFGRSQVELFEARRGWSHYITKEVADGAVHYDLGGFRRNRRSLSRNQLVA